MRFAFWRRRQAVPATQALRVDLPKPRRHHYAFAHEVLRSAAFTEPERLMGVMYGRDARLFLSDVMGQVTKRFEATGEKADFGAADLVVHNVRLGGHPGVIVEMPPPRAALEAFFVAIILLPPSATRAAAPAERPMRYFTLELGLVGAGAAGGGPQPGSTFLCEWTSRGVHRNLREGPAPQVGQFAKAVTRLLSKS